MAGSCCGLPWSSKGFGAAHRHKANELVERLWEWSGEGALPIVVDAASCTGSVVEPGEGTLSEANAEHLAAADRSSTRSPGPTTACCPALEITRKLDAAAIHPTCATHRQGHAWRLGALAAALADDVYLPPTGNLLRLRRRPRHLPPRADRQRHPRRRRAELAGRHFDAYLSSNRTCEIGLTRATGRQYESVINALERATRP